MRHHEPSFFDRFGQKEKSGLGGRSGHATTFSHDEDKIREKLLSELSALREHHESLQRQRDEEGSRPTGGTSGEVTHCFDPNVFGDNSQQRKDAARQAERNQRDAVVQDSRMHFPKRSNGGWLAKKGETKTMNSDGHQMTSEEIELQLGQDDKDAIEALFASDDFAEMFNAGGNVSRVPAVGEHETMLQHPQNAEQQPPSGSKYHPPVQKNRLSKSDDFQYDVAPVCHMCCKKLLPKDIAAYVSKSFDPTKPTARRKAGKK